MGEGWEKDGLSIRFEPGAAWRPQFHPAKCGAESSLCYTASFSLHAGSVQAVEGALVSHLYFVASRRLTHRLFPFPEDFGLGAGPPHAPVPSFSLPLSRLQRGLAKLQSRFGWWELAQPGLPAPHWLLITWGSRWRRPGLAAIGPVSLLTLAGRFQEETPAFHLGQERWNKQRSSVSPSLGSGSR